MITTGMLTACRSAPEATATPRPTLTSNPLRGRSSSFNKEATTVAPIPIRIATDQTATTTPTHQRYNPLQGEATLSSFSIPLENEWRHLILTDTTYRDELQTLATTNPLLHANPTLQTMVAQLFHSQEYAPPLLVAWPVDRENNPENDDIGLIAYVIPRRDLTLQRYLQAIEGALAMQPVFVIQETGLRYDIHPDVPIGYLQYLLLTEEPLLEGTHMHGYHYALFNHEATELLLLTFITQRPVDSGPVDSRPVDSGQEPATTKVENRPAPFTALVQRISRSPGTME